VEGFKRNGIHHYVDINLLCEQVNIIYRTREYYLMANETARQEVKAEETD
jgi:hypothetical protein